jgi:14-3-3 protein epsilon
MSEERYFMARLAD